MTGRETKIGVSEQTQGQEQALKLGNWGRENWSALHEAMCGNSMIGLRYQTVLGARLQGVAM